MRYLLLALQFAAGLAVLCIGAELFLRGAVRIAKRFGVSSFIIGFTLVGFGTSAPELAVNLSAALSGSSDLALGNVVGSNISNIGLILGLSALVKPLAVQMSLLRRETPILLGVSALAYALALDGTLSRIDGAVLLSLFVAVGAFVLRSARAAKPQVQAELAQVSEGREKPAFVGEAWEAAHRVPFSLLLLALGLGGLVGGAELMVRAAADLARLWGLSEMAIGMTIVAVGTSLPELASSVAAARKGEADIAVGNVLGSNLFNLLLILGTTAAVAPMGVPSGALRFDMPIMLAFTVLLVPVFWRRFLVTRAEGTFLLAAYAGFLAWQLVAAQAN